MQPRIDAWVNPDYRSEDAVADLRAWFAETPATPKFLDQFLRAEQAERLRESLLDSALEWRLVRQLVTSDHALAVTEDEWAAARPADRFGIQCFPNLQSAGVIRDPKKLEPLLDFFTLVTADASFREWIESIVNVEVTDRLTCELSRYARGAYLREHDDTHDARIVGLNFYISGVPNGESGGRLGYKNEAGEITLVTPTTNSLSIFPVRLGCTHWVTEWQGDQTGRITASLSYRPRVVSSQRGKTQKSAQPTL